ncbi:MAG: hypothetical protein ABIJ16_14105, partial [Bacteroidota bacterium]
MRKYYRNFITATLASVLTTSLAFSTTYYVSNAGSDLNTGTLPGDSWQTLDKVNSFSFLPGDSVLFNRGDIWRGQLIPHSGDSTGVVYYGAYGTGDKPLLLGSVDMSSDINWVNQGSNIWSTYSPVTSGTELIANPSFNTDAANWSFYTQGTAVATGSRTTGDYASSPASYEITCAANGDYFYDIQFSTQNIPVTAGNAYCLTFCAKSTTAFQPAGILLMKSISPYTQYSTNTVIPPMIDTVWTKYTMYFIANTTAVDGMVNFFLGNAIPDGTTLFLDDVSFMEATLNSPVVADIGNIICNNETVFGSKKWSLTDLQNQGDFWYDSDSLCVKIYSSGNPGTYYSAMECALTRNIIEEDEKNYITYENLALRYGGGHGIGGGNTHHITIRKCDISYIGGGGVFTQLYGNIRYGNGIEFWYNAHDNLVEQCHVWEIYDAAMTNQNDLMPAVQSDIIYRNNLIENSEYSFEYWNRPVALSSTNNIWFVNNTCIDAGKTWAHYQRESWDQRGRHLCFYENNTSTSEFHILNNIFSTATEEVLYVLKYSDLYSLHLDNNCFYQTPGDTMIKICYGTTIISSYTIDQFADYQSDYMQDTLSIAVWPLFTDTMAGDYSLLNSSACIDTGTPDTS